VQRRGIKSPGTDLAFFSSKTGVRYYGIFYHDEGGARYSGAFHQITEKTSLALTWIFRVTAFIGIAALLLEIICACLEFLHLLPDPDDFFLTFLAIGALGLIPAAAFVGPRKKVKLGPTRLDLDGRSSRLVYVSLLAYTAIYEIIILWSMVTPDPMPFAFFWTLCLLGIQVGSVYRLLRIRKASGSLEVNLVSNQDNG
jgi:hypothetical protein